MKILITDIHHGNGGGHVTYVLGLVRGLSRNHEVTVASPPTGRLYRRLCEMEGVRALPGLYTSRPLEMWREVRQLRRFLKAERFDVIHVNGGADHRHVMLATLGMRQRPGIVWTKHNTNPVSSIGHALRARFGTHTSIAVCEYVAGILQHSSYRQRPIQVVRNGIDTELLRPATPDEKAQFRDKLFGPLPPDAIVLGSLGGTDHNKGWHLLVQAASRLPEAMRARLRIVVAGDPPAAELVSQVEACGMTPYVHFPGLVSDVRSIVGACDVGFVLSFREAASYASCETMAMGVPALVSNAGGLPENVRHGTDGWIVPTGDVDALVAVLHQIFESVERLPAMGAAARERVETAFCRHKFILDTQAVYSDAFSLARGAAAAL